MRRHSHKLVDWLLVIFLFAAFFLTFISTILRNVGLPGLQWSDVAVRYIVIWLAFLGAAAARREKQHIVIEILPKILPPVPKRILEIFAIIVSTVISSLLAWVAFRFLLNERTLGTEGVLGMPAWWLETIIPIGFLLITVEHIVSLRKKIK